MAINTRSTWGEFTHATVAASKLYIQELFNLTELVESHLTETQDCRYIKASLKMQEFSTAPFTGHLVLVSRTNGTAITSGPTTDTTIEAGIATNVAGSDTRFSLINAVPCNQREDAMHSADPLLKFSSGQNYDLTKLLNQIAKNVRTDPDYRDISICSVEMDYNGIPNPTTTLVIAGMEEHWESTERRKTKINLL